MQEVLDNKLVQSCIKRQLMLEFAMLALENIANYTLPCELEETAEGEYGLDSEEAISMAYENVINDAKFTLERIRKIAEE